jgi:hypothetical protein
VITVAEISSTRPCPVRVCFVRVDGEPLFLCRDAVGTTIPAAPESSIRAGEPAGPSRKPVHTGEPWDDVVIAGGSTRIVLTGVVAAESTDVAG